LILVKDIELEFYAGWFRIILVLEYDWGETTGVLRVPVKLAGSIPENKQRIKGIIQAVRQLNLDKLQALKDRYVGVDLEAS